jgi:S-adenosylmethionine synthetase
VETSEQISAEDCEAIVRRIAGEDIVTRALIVPQDIHLAANQQHGVKCGDNGIFRGVPPTHEQKLLTAIAQALGKRLAFV